MFTGTAETRLEEWNVNTIAHHLGAGKALSLSLVFLPCGTGDGDRGGGGEGTRQTADSSPHRHRLLPPPVQIFHLFFLLYSNSNQQHQITWTSSQCIRHRSPS